MKKKTKAKPATKKIVRNPSANFKPISKTAGPKIQPLGSRVLIKPFTKEELEKSLAKNNFGIILPEADSKEKSEQGKVVAVGAGDWKDGKRAPLSVVVGDTVAFSKYGYDEVTTGGEEYYLIKEENILAILR
jgi:chaperonin GroES